MRHVFKTLVKFARTVAAQGFAVAMSQADEQTRREWLLNRIYNNRTGPGRKSCVVEHQRILTKHDAHLKRAKAKRWHPPLMDPNGNGAGLYLTPKDAARALKRHARFDRNHPNKPRPKWMTANAQQAMDQFSTGTVRR